jgi:glutamine amidotransferase
MIAVVDSGVANLASVMAALQRLGADAIVTSNADTLAAADRVIFPGVGAAAAAMARLTETGLSAVLRNLTQPVLGICLGMQLLFSGSDESGGVASLGVFDGIVRRLPAGPHITVPHMGWNTLKIDSAHPLLAGVEDGAFVYFVHSYAAAVGEHTLASCEHGTRFSAVVGQNNFFGCQFHPERSGAVGGKILQNFLAL